MKKFEIKPYKPSFEEEQVKVGMEVVKNWVWPFQQNLQGLKDIYSNSDFDPETALFCFKDEKMVGYVMARINVQEGVIGPGIKREGSVGASLDIPRVLQGYKGVEDLLMKDIITVLKSKGISFIQTRVSTMRENSIELAEKWGFKEHKDYTLGYKLYYHYDLNKGKIKERTVDVRTADVKRFNPNRDMNDCIESVASFFKRTKEKAGEDILDIDSSDDLVSHLVIRKNDKLEGYCYALPNSLNKGIIATFHLEASNEKYLKLLLIRVIDDCLEKGGKYFLVDVIGHLLQFENVFVELGFDKVATWGIYELDFSV